MSKHRYTRVGVALAALSAGAVGIVSQSAGAATGHAAGAAAVRLANVKVTVGSSNTSHQVLVSSSGKPIYLLTGDSSRHPLCESASCLGYWPAVTTSSKHPTLGKGVKGKVGVWHHGKINQVTLNGHPLYTYAADSGGTARGEGEKSFHGVWEVLSASGSGMSASSFKGGSGGSSSGSGGSGGSGSGGGGDSWS